MCLFAFPIHPYLAFKGTLLEMFSFEIAYLFNTNASGVEKFKEVFVTWVRLHSDDPLYILFAHNEFRQIYYTLFSMIRKYALFI